MEFYSNLLKEIEPILKCEGNTLLLSEFKEISKKIEEGKFTIAVLGEFKRGKSSLLNSLIKEKIFPVGILPLTSVITIAEYGEEEKIFVHFLNLPSIEIKKEEIENYVTEKGNSGNRLNVKVVQIFSNSDFLKNNIKLVDTPGIGSVIEENSKVTEGFIKKVDVGIVVTGYDPPLTSNELNMIKTLKKENILSIIVFNKKDLYSREHRIEIENFTKDVLRKENIEISHFFTISAKYENPEKEGLEDLKNFLNRLAQETSDEIVEKSVKKSIKNLLQELENLLTLEIKTLKEPIESLDEKLKIFEEKIKDLKIWILAAREACHHEFKIDLNEKEEIRENLFQKAIKTLQETEISTSDKKKIRNKLKDSARIIAKEISETYLKEINDLLGKITEKRKEVIKREFEKVSQRITDTFLETFGFSYPQFSLDFLSRRLKTKKSFDFIEKILALDIKHLIYPIIDFILPKKMVISHSKKSVLKLLKEWLFENFAKIDDYFVEVLDETTKEELKTFENMMKELHDEMIRTINKAKSLKESEEEKLQEELKTMENYLKKTKALLLKLS